MYKQILTLIAIISILPMIGCSNIERSYGKVKNIYDERPQKGLYTAYGRIYNQQSTGIKGCQIYLIQRKFSLVCGDNPDCNIPDTKVLDESLVAVSSKTGDYQFSFEPDQANNIWVYYQAPGYKPRMVELDKQMHGKLFRDPGTILIHKNIVLNPIAQQSASK